MPSLTETYEGFAHDGVRQGFGMYRYHDGSRYEGEWQEGRRNGWGTTTDNRGRVYVGQYCNDLRHGYGASLTETVRGCVSLSSLCPRC